jgi:hypothetical protein
VSSVRLSPIDGSLVSLVDINSTVRWCFLFKRYIFCSKVSYFLRKTITNLQKPFLTMLVRRPRLNFYRICLSHIYSQTINKLIFKVNRQYKDWGESGAHILVVGQVPCRFIIYYYQQEISNRGSTIMPFIILFGFWSA